MITSQTLQVKLRESDAAGRLYFATPFHWCQDLCEAFLHEKGFGLHVMFKGEFQTPIVHASVDHHAPALLGDLLTVAMMEAKIGGSSVTFQYEISREGKPISTVKMIHVCVSVKDQKPIPVPEFLKGFFS